MSGPTEYPYGPVRVGALGSQVINVVLGPISFTGPVGPQIHPVKMSLDAKCTNEMDTLGNWQSPYMGSLAFEIRAVRVGKVK